MTDEVRDSYDAMVQEYVAVALDDVDRVPGDWEWLARFAELASRHDGTVLDLGCGPGHVANHLTQLGLAAVGYDIAPGMIAEARRRFPDSQFHVGDFAALDVDDASVGGIVARHSLIHTLPTQLDSVFREWRRVLEPNAPVLVSFFAAPSAEAHGSPFDHAVTTAYALHLGTIEESMQDAGLVVLESALRDPLPGQRPMEHGTVLAREPSAETPGPRAD